MPRTLFAVIIAPQLALKKKLKKKITRLNKKSKFNPNFYQTCLKCLIKRTHFIQEENWNNDKNISIPYQLNHHDPFYELNLKPSLHLETFHLRIIIHDTWITNLIDCHLFQAGHNLLKSEE